MHIGWFLARNPFPENTGQVVHLAEKASLVKTWRKAKWRANREVNICGNLIFTGYKAKQEQDEGEREGELKQEGEKNNESIPLVMWTLLYKAILLQELNSSSLSLPPRGNEPKPFCVNRHRYLRHRQQRRFTLAQETFYEYVATLAAA